jgi:UDP-glucose 4-epimerase
MRVLITGGAGFIGSHLAELCLERGDEVHVVDDLSTGAVENVQHLRDHPRFHCHVDTVDNVPLTAELIDLCDVVYHLAAAVGVRLIVESPVHTIETNLRGTEVVLRLAAKKRKRVLVASTSEVYGKRLRVPFREDDDLVLGPPHRGRWSYAASKAMDEFLALAYWKEKRVPTVIVRLFNTVGPRQTGRYGMVVPTMVRQALGDEPLTVFGDGLQSRCFAHVHDVVGALVAVAEHPAAVGEVYNVGNDEEVTVLELADRIRALARSRSSIAFVPYDEAYEAGFEDMLRRVPDLSKLHGLIGYRPTFDLDAILHDVIAHEAGRVARRDVPGVRFGAALARAVA